MPHPGMRHAGQRLVFVRDLEIVASVGVFEREKRYEQRIIVPAELAVRDDYDGRSDRLADVNLIETLAERIAAHCLTAESRAPGCCASRSRTSCRRAARSGSRSSGVGRKSKSKLRSAAVRRRPTAT
jgi:hypothetical protein